MKRGIGILLHISSLQNEQGIGCFDKEAYKFVDFLAEAGVTYWQVLPMNPVEADGYSPYSPLSVFAGNPLFIDLTQFLSKGEIKKYNLNIAGDKVDFKKVAVSKTKALVDIYNRGLFCSESLNTFANENQYWLKPYAEWMSNKYGGDINYYIFTQWLFFEQWIPLKKYANEKGILIVGDTPIYTAMNSADVYAWPEVFDFTKGKPNGVGGVPPDDFNSAGQNWGAPLYNWERLKKEKYRWWCERIAQSQKMYDILRIDHFRAFDAYYKIPHGDKDAKRGKWQKGPGMELFNVLKQTVPSAQLILEDLGGEYVKTVVKLRDETGFPGMKIFQFAFDGTENVHTPKRYTENCVAYMGTHDNDTFIGFLRSCDNQTRQRVEHFLNAQGMDEKQMTQKAFEVILKSKDNMAVLVMQDLLYQGSESRMNTPGMPTGQWEYRIPKGCLTSELAKYIRSMSKKSGRENLDK